jgi:hypothetical protein
MDNSFMRPYDPFYDKTFKFIDVPGDGSCFYHSLAVHDQIPFNHGEEVRSFIFNSALNNADIFKLLMIYDCSDLTFEDFCTFHIEQKRWATEAVFYFAAMALKIDLVLFTNSSTFYRPLYQLLGMAEIKFSQKTHT